MLPWVAVRVFHDVTADDLGVALVPWPVELGDEIAVDGQAWPHEVVDLGLGLTLTASSLAMGRR